VRVGDGAEVGGAGAWANGPHAAAASHAGARVGEQVGRSVAQAGVIEEKE
jgi:hypothetical protein